MANQETSRAGDASPAGGSDSRLFGIEDLVRIIRDRWVWGLIVAILVAGNFAVWVMQQRPVYRAEATLLLEDSPDRVVNIQRIVDQSLDPFSLQIQLNNHLEQMRSQGFIARVMESMTEEQLKELAAPYTYRGEPLPATQVISEHFHVQLLYETQVFKLGYDHHDPEIAANMANRLAHEYINYLAARAGTGNERGLVFLEEQAAHLRKKLEADERTLQKYREEHNMISMENNQAIMSEQLKEISTSLTQTEVELNRFLAKIGQITEASSRQELLALPFIAAYGEIAELQVALGEAQRERDVLSRTYLPKHPEMQANESRIKALQERIDTAIAMSRQELHNRAQELLAQKNKLAKQMEDAEKRGIGLEEAAIEYNVLTRNRDTTKKTYTQILDRLDEAKISAQLTDSNLRLVDLAGPPSKPFTPDKKHVAAVSAFLAGFTFFTVPLLMHLGDRRLRKASEVSDFLGQELVGVVPKARKAQRKTLANPAEASTECPIGESFRAIYSSLKLTGDGASSSMMVTSTLPSEGKSVVAAHIAAAFSRHDKRTLLIDCDFRRPCAHRMFGLDNSKGVLRWHASDRPVPNNGEVFTDPDLGIERPAPRLFICRAGGMSDSATEILQSDRFLKLLATFKESFDMVIVDTAPAGLFPEAFLMGNEVDRTLYVVEHNKIPRAQVRRILERIGRTRTQIAGIVFNKVRGQHDDLLHSGNYGYNMQAGGRQYGKYYRHYYGRRVG